MNENDTPRAEQVIPPGFRPIQWPHVVDIDAKTSTDDEPMIVAQGDLRATAEALGSIELLATILHEDRPGGSPIARQIAEMAGFWQRHVRMLAGVAAVMVLSVVGVMLPTSAPAAQAATTTPAAAPTIEAPQPDGPVFTQHPTRFGRGTWLDTCDGNLFVAAPLTELVPNLGWLPSPWARVLVQESTRRGIRTRAALSLTNAEGIARAVIHIGGGVRNLRVVHLADAWTLRTTGSWRRVNVTTESCDIV